VWWTALAVCMVAIVFSVDGRRLPRWMSRVPWSRRRRSRPHLLRESASSAVDAALLMPAGASPNCSPSYASWAPQSGRSGRWA